MTDEEKFKELLEPYRNELRRGLIILAVLSQLGEAQYGYSLIKQLGEKGFDVDQGTLYPLLRRLEDRGLAILRFLQLAQDCQDDQPAPQFIPIRCQQFLEIFFIGHDWLLILPIFSQRTIRVRVMVASATPGDNFSEKSALIDTSFSVLICITPLQVTLDLYIHYTILYIVLSIL